MKGWRLLMHWSTLFLRESKINDYFQGFTFIFSIITIYLWGYYIINSNGRGGPPRYINLARRYVFFDEVASAQLHHGSFHQFGGRSWAHPRLNCKKYICLYIGVKTFMDKTFEPAWHCIVGKGFGSAVTYVNRHLLFLYIANKAILIFKYWRKKSSEKSNDILYKITRKNVKFIIWII